MAHLTWAALLSKVRQQYHVTEVSEFAVITVETPAGGHVTVQASKLAYTPADLLALVDRAAEQHDRTLPAARELRAERPHNTLDLRGVDLGPVNSGR